MENFHYAMVKYLTKLRESRKDEYFETAVDMLAGAFNLEVNEENDQEYGDFDLDTIFLESIGEEKWTPELENQFETYKQMLKTKGYFNDVQEGSNEYNERLSKAKERFLVKYSQEKKKKPKKQARVYKLDVSEEDKAQAEFLKNVGNDSFKANDFDTAINWYSQAIDIYSNAIYYCNRGTTYGKLNKHNEALEDFLSSVELNPKYVRAYDRLGCTYMKLEKYKYAIESFEKGLKLEPNNKDLNLHLKEANDLLKKSYGSVGVPPSLEQMQEILNNPDLSQNLGPLQSMFKENPEILNMAMNMMHDPNFQQTMMGMMNSPQFSNLLSNMTKGKKE